MDDDDSEEYSQSFFFVLFPILIMFAVHQRKISFCFFSLSRGWRFCFSHSYDHDPLRIFNAMFICMANLHPPTNQSINQYCLFVVVVIIVYPFRTNGLIFIDNISSYNSEKNKQTFAYTQFFLLLREIDFISGTY